METLISKSRNRNPRNPEAQLDVILVTGQAGFSYDSYFGENKIVVVKEGELEVSFGKYSRKTVKAKNMFILPSGARFRFKATEDFSALIIKISAHEHFTRSWALDGLCEYIGEPDAGFEQLEITPNLFSYFKGLEMYVRDGVRSDNFYRYKIRELLFLMKSYYPQAELTSFFRPLVSRNSEFMDFIYDNYHKYKNVQQLAAASCHSLSSFNKLFRKTFGTSPYLWMKEQKAKHVYYDVTSTDLTIKEICNRHGFGSLSQFANFCKSQFGCSPRRMRELSSMSNRIVSEIPEL